MKAARSNTQNKPETAEKMKEQTFKILAIGDVVGEAGTAFLEKRLPALKAEHRPELVIVNGENACRNNGLDPAGAERIFAAGADLITTGNHVFRKKELYPVLDGEALLLRPANFPGECPGKGTVIAPFRGVRILAVNLLGTLFMESLASPFETMEKILRAEEGRYDFAVCDFHAEATSEKIAFARHFDGRVAVVFGTHTHVPTADLQIFPGGTAYITDLGMTGPADSVLGMKTESAIRRLVSKMPSYYEVADGPCVLQGALFECSDAGKVLSTRQILETERE